MLTADSRVGAVQPRPVDPTGKPAPKRWVPRPGGRDPLRPGRVGWLWEGTFVIRRHLFEQAGGWPGHFWYGHEGIELAWRVWDAGSTTWYAPDVVINHPATSPTRHDTYYRLNARNRVWVARRNLPVAAGRRLPDGLDRADRRAVPLAAAVAGVVRRVPRGTGARCRGTAADALADRVAADTCWSSAGGLTYRFRTGGGP